MLKAEDIRRAVCGAYQTNAYIVCPEGAQSAFVVDPGDCIDRLRLAVQKAGRPVEALLLTHGHFDHTLGAQPLQEDTGAIAYISAEDAEMLEDPDLSAYDPAVCALTPPTDLDTAFYGTTVKVCGLTLQVLATPGHSKGSVCLYEPEGKILFSGDTLFCAGFGRMDLHGGSQRAMMDSIRRLFTLPDDTLVLPGHGGETTIGAEKRRYGR